MMTKAIISGDITKVNEFISSGMDMNSWVPCMYYKPLDIAVHIRHVEICRVLISLGVEKNSRLLYHLFNNDRHRSDCLNGRSETYGTLCLEYCSKMSDYSIPLYNPPEDARIEVLKLLFSNDAFRAESINAINECDILLTSTRQCLIQETKLLLEAGANPNLQEKYAGNTPLHIAADKGNFELCKMLLEFNANPNVQDERFGCTPLHLAVSKGKFKICRMLLDYGADMHVKTTSHQTTPIDICRYKQIRDYMIQLQTMRSEMKRAHPDEDDDNSNDDDNQDDDGEEELNSDVRSGMKRAHPDEDDDNSNDDDNKDDDGVEEIKKRIE
jgi:ankyrin repeat protein